eukprot:jgi/Bigna1/140148/aug1.54_g14856
MTSTFASSMVLILYPNSWEIFTDLSEVISSAAVIVQEGVLKVIFGMQAVLFFTKSGGEIVRNWSLKKSIATAGIPAMLYAVQNLLTIVAMNKIDGLTYNILNQSKLIWNAVFVYIFLEEKFRPAQVWWVVAFDDKSGCA